MSGENKNSKHNNELTAQSIFDQFTRHKRAALVAAVSTLGLVNVQAEGLYQNDLNMMAYITVPFSGEKSFKRDDSLKLGFLVNQSYTPVNYTTGIDLASDYSYRLPLVDIQYSSETNYFSKSTVGGVDALTYEMVMNADGTVTQWPMGLSTTQVVMGVVAGAGIGYGISEAVSDDDDDQAEEIGTTDITF